MNADPLTPTPPRPAIFLDRDDTLNANADLPGEAFPATRGDLYRPEHVRLLPGVRDACIRLADAGFALIVITNQASVARGSATIRDIEATNDRLRELLTIDGRCLIDAVYAAPHHPEAVVDHLRSAHPWRKPGPGMLLAAARELNLDLSRSWLVGDAERDLEAGRATGIPDANCLRVGSKADFPGLPDAADHILSVSSGMGILPVSSPGTPDLRAGSPGTPDLRAGSPVSNPGTECRCTRIPASTVTLRTHDSSPLADPETRRTVEAAAHAIAERTGITLIQLDTDDRSITATLATHRLAALGFMAELRRSTNAWYTSRNPGPALWSQSNTPDA